MAIRLKSKRDIVHVKAVLAPFPASKSQCNENEQGWDLPSFGVIAECVTDTQRDAILQLPWLIWTFI